ncbi:hypothetical protein ACFC08_22355 [Streptomyces sp. NPDC056112]|uniref:hypothetical protein n=1 Tax=unclassified Streptomyces TaxID=2593676 RepID=UPI001CD1D6C1|nr:MULTISPECIES: hypothetical protein [unclassified Streptomyces]
MKPLIVRPPRHRTRLGLGTQRGGAERAFAHLRWFPRLRIGWEIRDDIHEAIIGPAPLA